MYENVLTIFFSFDIIFFVRYIGGEIMDLNTINIIALAYLGDSIYEVYIRESLLKNGYAKVDDMQKEAVNYVSAKSQCRILDDMINSNMLNEEELEVVRRGRNYKRSIHPKNTDIITYKKSSGFEALIGYLYLKDKKRLNGLREVLNYIEVK